jgi:hypothetical protein
MNYLKIFLLIEFIIEQVSKPNLSLVSTLVMQTNNKVAILFSFIITQVEHLIGRQTWLPWAERRKEISKKTKKNIQRQIFTPTKYLTVRISWKKRIIDGPSCFEQKNCDNFIVLKHFLSKTETNKKMFCVVILNVLISIPVFALFLLSQITIILIF